MKKAIYSSFLFIFLSLTVQAQMPEHKLSWRAEPLTWADFTGDPDISKPFHANTSSGISYYWSMKQSGDDIEFVYDVQSYFIPEESWVKGGKGSDHLLIHEQLHFDITELHARKLRKAMEEFDLKENRNVKPALQAIYKRTEAERAQMQKKFDFETRHSVNAEAQLKWQKVIREELKKLEKFSS